MSSLLHLNVIRDLEMLWDALGCFRDSRRLNLVNNIPILNQFHEFIGCFEFDQRFFGMLWDSFGCFGDTQRLRIFKFSISFRDFFGFFQFDQRFRDSLRCFQMLWETLGCSGD